MIGCFGCYYYFRYDNYYLYYDLCALNHTIWCDCESQIASDLKGSALRFCCDLKKAANDKSRDLSCDLKRF